jgi:hypothetical protein
VTVVAEVTFRMRRRCDPLLQTSFRTNHAPMVPKCCFRPAFFRPRFHMVIYDSRMLRWPLRFGGLRSGFCCRRSCVTSSSSARHRWYSALAVFIQDQHARSLDVPVGDLGRHVDTFRAAAESAGFTVRHDARSSELVTVLRAETEAPTPDRSSRGGSCSISHSQGGSAKVYAIKRAVSRAADGHDDSVAFPLADFDKVHASILEAGAGGTVSAVVSGTQVRLRRAVSDTDKWLSALYELAFSKRTDAVQVDLHAASKEFVATFVESATKLGVVTTWSASCSTLTLQRKNTAVPDLQALVRSLDEIDQCRTYSTKLGTATLDALQARALELGLSARTAANGLVITRNASAAVRSLTEHLSSLETFGGSRTFSSKLGAEALETIRLRAVALGLQAVLAPNGLVVTRVACEKAINAVEGHMAALETVTHSRTFSSKLGSEVLEQLRGRALELGFGATMAANGLVVTRRAPRGAPSSAATTAVLAEQIAALESVSNSRTFSSKLGAGVLGALQDRAVELRLDAKMGPNGLTVTRMTASRDEGLGQHLAALERLTPGASRTFTTKLGPEALETLRSRAAELGLETKVATNGLVVTPSSRYTLSAAVAVLAQLPAATSHTFTSRYGASVLAELAVAATAGGMTATFNDNGLTVVRPK